MGARYKALLREGLGDWGPEGEPECHIDAWSFYLYCNNFFFFFFGCAACSLWDLSSWLGIEPGSLQWKLGVLTNGLPGNSLSVVFINVVVVVVVPVGQWQHFHCFLLWACIFTIKNKQPREFPGGPVVMTWCSHCQGLGFSPWSGN